MKQKKVDMRTSNRQNARQNMLTFLSDYSLRRDLTLDFLIHYAFSVAKKHFFHVHKIKADAMAAQPGNDKVS